MLYTIENNRLKVSVDTAGAQLQSIYSKKTGTEYLWQGDEKYWKGRAYNLFPIIGRLYNGVYTYEEIDYSLPCHGIARYNEFVLTERTATKLVFALTHTEETLQNYPFRFTLFVEFSLEKDKLNCNYTVKNEDEVEMVFALGGHPGFNVPFKKGTAFEDYYLEFAEKTQTVWHTLSQNKLMSGKVKYFLMDDGVRLPLQHGLFDDDAIILGNTCRSVTLKSAKTKKSLKFDYPGFKFLGLWHMPQTDAPYICLEPWSALPATDGVVDDLKVKLDMTHLDAGKSYSALWSVTVNE